MALDAVTIVGLVLGVLGLFGITLMYDLTKKVGSLLPCKSLRRRHRVEDAEGLPMTSADTQYASTVAANTTACAMNSIGISPVDIGLKCGDTCSGSHEAGTACCVSQRNDHSNTTPSTSSPFVNAPNDGRPTVTTEQHDGLPRSIVRATAVSSYLTSSARNRHHGSMTPMSLAPIQNSTPAASAPDPRPALPFFSSSTRPPETVVTTTDSASSGTSEAAETTQSSSSSGSHRQTQPAPESRSLPDEETTTEDETQLEEVSTEVQEVTPYKGPLNGGEPIVILGVGFPSILLYVRFGDNFTIANRRNETVLQCTLPTACRPGWVHVTLSQTKDQNAPNFGKSIARFLYEDARIEVLLYLLKLVYEKADGGSLENVAASAKQYLQNSITSAPSSTRPAERHNDALEVDGLEDVAIGFLSNYCGAEEWKVTISSCNKHGQTLAHVSVMLGYLKLLRYLVIWGMDLNLVDFQGSTALHYAFLCNKAECAIFLIRSGADELILDALGQSAWVLNPALGGEVTSLLRPTSKFSSSSMFPRILGLDTKYKTEQPEAGAALRAKYLLVERWLQQMEEENQRAMPNQIKRENQRAMSDQMRRDLDTLRHEYEAAQWLPGHEPIIGSPDVHPPAEQYGDRGRSCYVVFVYKKAAGTYGCRHDRCFRDGDDKGPSFYSMAEAIKHQRNFHFISKDDLER